MTCADARDLLFDEQEGLLTEDQHTLVRVHLDACADCRAEEAALNAAYAAMNRGMHSLVAPVTPSPAFWQRLNAGLDAIDTERRASAPRAGRLGMAWRRRWLAAGALLAATVGGLVAVGGPRQAWADLVHLLYAVPFLDVGQQQPTALVAAPSTPSYRNGMTLSVTGLISGRRTTLLSYRLSGRALLRAAGSAQVADAVEVVLNDAQGRRFEPTFWLPEQRSLAHGVPTIQGLLAFPALPRGEQSIRVIATRLPLAPLPAHPWSVTLALRQAAHGGALASEHVIASASHYGIRLGVTDLTRSGHELLVDMDSAIRSGPYRGGAVVSLAPGQAVGNFAPTLTLARGGTLRPALSPLSVPVQLALAPKPEFIYRIGAADSRRMTLAIPAVQVRLPGSASMTIGDGTRQNVNVGRYALTLSGHIIAPPAGLGLDGERRLRLTVTFPSVKMQGAVQSVAISVNGVSQTVSRDDPRLDLPLSSGRRAVYLTMDGPTIMVPGPWRITLDEHST